MAELKPYAQDWIDGERIVGRRFVLHGSVEELRYQYNEMGEALTPFALPLPDSVNIREVQVPNGPTVRIYTPQGVDDTLPVGVYIHGGGWILCDLDSEDYICRKLAVSVPTVLVSVDYRLAPEHKYPAGLDDCETAFKWVRSNTDHISSNDRIYIIGGSAGANLAIALALRILNWTTPEVIKGVVGVCPVTVDPSVVPHKFQKFFTNPEANADSAVIDEEVMEKFRVEYGPPSRSDPYFSVLLHERLASLPPTYLVGCGKDPLSGDVLAFHQALDSAGVRTKLDFYNGYPHYFWNFPVEIRHQMIADLISGVQWVIKSMS